MTPRILPFVSMALLGGCGLLAGREAPNIPGDFPQLGEYDSGRAQLVVDGVELDTDGYCSFDDSGVDESKLRMSLRFDFLSVQVRDFEEGEYSSVAREVEASWSENDRLESAGCGESIVRFEGTSTTEYAGVEERATWGTVQLVVCDEADAFEISGKFSCTL